MIVQHANVSKVEMRRLNLIVKPIVVALDQRV